MVNIFAVDIYTWSFKNSKTKAILAEREIIIYTLCLNVLNLRHFMSENPQINTHFFYINRYLQRRP